jgi:hypothetical protein
MSRNWWPAVGEDYPHETCQECGRVLTRGGMLCPGCQYGWGLDAPDAGASVADWDEPKVVVYESKLGLVIWRYCWTQRALDRWMTPWPGFRSAPQVMTIAQLRQRQIEARAEDSVVQYRPKQKDGEP